MAPTIPCPACLHRYAHCALLGIYILYMYATCPHTFGLPIARRCLPTVPLHYTLMWDIYTLLPITGIYCCGLLRVLVNTARTLPPPTPHPPTCPYPHLPSTPPPPLAFPSMPQHATHTLTTPTCATHCPTRFDLDMDLNVGHWLVQWDWDLTPSPTPHTPHTPTPHTPSHTPHAPPHTTPPAPHPHPYHITHPSRFGHALVATRQLRAACPPHAHLTTLHTYRLRCLPHRGLPVYVWNWLRRTRALPGILQVGLLAFMCRLRLVVLWIPVADTSSLWTRPHTCRCTRCTQRTTRCQFGVVDCPVPLPDTTVRGLQWTFVGGRTYLVAFAPSDPTQRHHEQRLYYPAPRGMRLLPIHAIAACLTHPSAHNTVRTRAQRTRLLTRRRTRTLTRY